MKTSNFHYCLFCYSIFLLVNINTTFADLPNNEIYIINKLTNSEQQNLFVKFYPIGGIFSGHNSPTESIFYSLKSKDNNGVTRRGEYSNYKEFPEAVISYKGLIDNFASSEYIFTSAYESYDCYLALDTSDDKPTNK